MDADAIIEQIKILCERYELRDIRTPVGTGHVPVRDVRAILNGVTADEAYRRRHGD